MNAWFEAFRFASDVQRVIASRLVRIGMGGPLAATEANRMILEKVATFGEAQLAMTVALTSGKSFGAAAAKAYAPYRRSVRANRRRLCA